MKTLTLLTATFCCSLIATGQSANSTIMLNNVMEIDKTRYDGIDRSPYLFKEFVTAKVYDKKAGKTEKYTMNFNGHTQDFEFIYKENKIALNEAYYDVIEMTGGRPSGDYSSKFFSESVRFVKGIDPKSPKKFQIVIYSDENISIIKKFEMRIQTSESTGSGQGIVTKTLFNPFISYYKVENGVTGKLKLNKKSVMESLNNEKVTSYIKKNKLKVSNEEQLKVVMAYYNDLTTSSDRVATNK